MLYPLSYGSIIPVLQSCSTLLRGREVASRRSNVTGLLLERPVTALRRFSEISTQGKEFSRANLSMRQLSYQLIDEIVVTWRTSRNSLPFFVQFNNRISPAEVVIPNHKELVSKARRDRSATLHWRLSSRKSMSVTAQASGRFRLSTWKVPPASEGSFRR
jgi:hypothetical protein